MPQIRLFTAAVTVTATLLFAHSARANEPVAPSVLPAGGFDFTGRWQCEGAFRGGTAHRSQFHGQTAVGGQWLELDEVDQQPATGYVAKYLIGYDPHKRRFVEFDASNSAASVYSSGRGWTGGALTLTSDPLDDPALPYVKDRFVYTIISAKTFSIDWQVTKDKATEWLEGDHLNCARARDRASRSRF